MKRSAIEVGGVYSNGKKGLREVLGFSVNYPGCCYGVRNTDNVQYKILGSRYKGEVGEIYIMTARRFASWAKSRENPCP